MKIAIVTLYGNDNYGNRLQNYALNFQLKKMGYSAETLAVVRKQNFFKKFIKKFLYKSNGAVKFKSRNEIKREKEFKKFTESYIPTKVLYRSDNTIDSQTGKEYDAFIVGSDQVWNPLFWEDNYTASDANNYLLMFTEGKKISYAASFGIGKLPCKWEKTFTEQLSKFDNISVREYAGAEIVKECINTQVPVVLDPTMLLSAKEWRKLYDKSTSSDKKYILTYFLGEISDEVKKLIDKAAEENNLELIQIMDENGRAYSKGPISFLEYFDKADLVFTDSFHACVFSILFHTPFAVYDRKHANNSNMNSRILTLLELMDLKDRYNRRENLFECDFSKADKKLEKEKERSIEFLMDSLK